MTNRAVSNTENLVYLAKFISTDNDAVLISRSGGHGTSLYIGEGLDEIEGYYIRAEAVFVKGNDMDVKFDNESKTIIISIGSDEFEEPDYIYDYARDDIDYEEHVDKEDMYTMN